MKSLKHLPKENKMLIKGFLAQLTPKLKKDLYFKKDSDLSKSIKVGNNLKLNYYFFLKFY